MMNPCSTQNLPSYDQALNRVLTQISPLSIETLSYRDARGRTLACDVHTDRDQPPFDRSAMDGFAVRSADIQRGVDLKITGSVPAGGPPICYQTPVEAGCAYRIATGAPVPAGADAVIPIESAKVQEGDHPKVSFYIDTVPSRRNIHPQGADAKAHDLVIKSGTVLSAQHIGIACASGNTQLQVIREPKVVLLTTGDEVCPPETKLEQLEPQQIRNSNGPMLLALLSQLGITDVTHHHLPDEPKPTFDAAQAAMNQADLVLTVGGVSVGQRDHLPATWKKLGADILVHGTAIKPGKPVFVATQNKTLILGLPGNPGSVFTTAHLFLLPILSKMLNRPAPIWQNFPLATEVKAQKDRDRFILVRIMDQKAHFLSTQGSGDLMHTAQAHGFVRVNRSTEPCKAGQTEPFLPLL
ncbi:MAG: molybdopterin molybdotransferase MoeA [Phycisphaeraceae bacterium]|nr:molybdopterin molybdotransferase MoeA [Phycisphaeraceae bacterium]